MSEYEQIMKLQRWIGIILDAAVDKGNGKSIVPTDVLKDVREAVFGARAENE